MPPDHGRNLVYPGRPCNSPLGCWVELPPFLKKCAKPTKPIGLFHNPPALLASQGSPHFIGVLVSHLEACRRPNAIYTSSLPPLPSPPRPALTRPDKGAAPSFSNVCEASSEDSTPSSLLRNLEAVAGFSSKQGRSQPFSGPQFPSLYNFKAPFHYHFSLLLESSLHDLRVMFLSFPGSFFVIFTAAAGTELFPPCVRFRRSS